VAFLELAALSSSRCSARANPLSETNTKTVLSRRPSAASCSTMAWTASSTARLGASIDRNCLSINDSAEDPSGDSGNHEGGSGAGTALRFGY
jgi:hypothetical protein